MIALTAAARQGRDGNRLGAQHGRVAASAATPKSVRTHLLKDETR